MPLHFELKGREAPLQAKDWVTFILSCATVLIAWQVYLVQKNKLFLDLMSVRLAAIRRVQDSITERMNEIETDPYYISQSHMPKSDALSAFWVACNEAKPLFGSEISSRMDEIEGALKALVFARYNDRDNLQYDYERWMSASEHVRTLRGQLADESAPYTHLGRRGLELRQQHAIRMKGTDPYGLRRATDLTILIADRCRSFIWKYVTRMRRLASPSPPDV